MAESIWKRLVASPETRVLLWLGGRRIYGSRRVWDVWGPLAPEYGFWMFEVDGGRRARFIQQNDPCPPPDDWDRECVTRTGYLVGNRFIPDDGQARSYDRLADAINYHHTVYLVPHGLERFARVQVGFWHDGKLVFISEVPGKGGEEEAERLFQDRVSSGGALAGSGATPALDLAFRMHTEIRARSEAADAERRRREEEERRRQEAAERVGSSVGRRILAQLDFREAARAALAISGAELLDERDHTLPGQKVVTYRYLNHRLGCVVDSRTLRVVEAGICLTSGGVTGDTFFTLESLPSVVKEADDDDVLVIYRHG